MAAVRIARLFDVVDRGGPRMAADHLRLDPGEAPLVLSYLLGGVPLVLGTVPMDDVLDPTRRAVVPMAFCTDGAWVWCHATAYYLREYGLAPDPELLAHVRAAGYVLPHVDGAAVRRALAALREPLPQPPAWTAAG